MVKGHFISCVTGFSTLVYYQSMCWTIPLVCTSEIKQHFLQHIESRTLRNGREDCVGHLSGLNWIKHNFRIYFYFNHHHHFNKLALRYTWHSVMCREWRKKEQRSSICHGDLSRCANACMNIFPSLCPSVDINAKNSWFLYFIIFCLTAITGPTSF